MRLAVKTVPKGDYAYRNMVYVHPSDHAVLATFLPVQKAKDARVNVQLLGKVWACGANDAIEKGTVALNVLQRTFASAVLDEPVEVVPFSIPVDKPFMIAELRLRVAPLVKPKEGAPLVVLDVPSLTEEVVGQFKDQIMMSGLKFAYMYRGPEKKASDALMLEVLEMKFVPLTGTAGGQDTGGGSTGRPQFSSLDAQQQMGHFSDKVTQLQFVKGDGIQLKDPKAPSKQGGGIMEFDFLKLGIGGLNTEFEQIFRRAFASRVYPPDIVEKMGLTHVKGLILFGPPGCGKTLIARQLSKALQAGGEDTKREPKIVNGPEAFSRYVGEAEKFIRDLFVEAEADQKAHGNESELHVIIFDEFDALARKRGSGKDGTNVGDNVVNQLLAKIDGVDQLNNVLIIAMTNRLDMLDPALLRPGRFEVQIEISLPNFEGRQQILTIKTTKMRESNYLDASVNIPILAEKTKNFTGAEIEGLVKNAAGYAFRRQIDFKTGLRKITDANNVKLVMDDFEEALKECKPQFGAVEIEEEMRKNLGNLVSFSDDFDNVSRLLRDLSRRAANEASDKSSLSLVSVMLCGEAGCGKSALAHRVAFESGFPFVRIISPDKFIGMNEISKSGAISDIFEEAYKSEKSLLVLEDIERLIEYAKMGQRFSNAVLQTLLILIRKAPPKKGRRLFIIGTSSVPELMEPLDLVSVFNMVLHLPQVRTQEEVMRVVRSVPAAKLTSEDDLHSLGRICPFPISVKKLLLALEMAGSETEGGGLDPAKFGEFLAVR